MRRLFLLFAFFANACLADLYINEIQSGNTKIADDVGNLTSDWVEIYNSGPAARNLQGYHLSDSVSNPTKWAFPNVNIPAGGYVLVWASNLVPPPSPMHASFAISSAGESILLSDPQGNLLDQFPPRALVTDTSMGRQPEGTGPLLFFAQPTPGAANTASGTPIDLSPAPSFSVPGGLFSNNVTLTMSTAVAGGTIRYTLDGSEPNTNSAIYSNAITLTNPSNNANILSEVPTNYLDTGGPYYEGWQPPNGKVFKINVVRARVFKDGSDPGAITTQSYLIDPAGASRYAAYPVISIVTARANLVDPEIGIYVPGNNNNYLQKGSEWERPGHVEFFESGGQPAFQASIGLRLNGNTTRNRPRKALRVYNRDASRTFNYQIFPEKAVSKFDIFLLRASGNDWGQSLFRDAFATSLGTFLGLDYQSSRPVVVFLTGEYWGLHNIRDRISEGYFQTHHGLGETNYTLLEIAAENDSWPVVDSGSPGLLSDFEDILNKAAAGQFSTAEGLAALGARVDLDNFTDYQIAGIWSGNTDWPGNNIMLWRAVTPDTAPGADPKNDGRWRWILKDMDFALGLDFFYVPGWTEGPNFNSLAYASTDNFNSSPSFIGNQEKGTRLLRKLLDNSAYRVKFLNRFADLLNTGLSATNMSTRLSTFEAAYSPGIIEHTNRWRQPFNWANDVNRIRNYVTNRPAALRGHITTRFSLPGTANLTVNTSGTDQGTVTVNTIRLAPSTEGVAANPYPWTGVYFQEVPITLSADASPGYRFTFWNESSPGASNVVAADSSANYGQNWADTPNGGYGFGAWTLTDTSSWDDGFFIGNSSRSIHSLSPDGRSFGIYAHSGGSASALRPFGGGALLPDQTFSVKISPGGFSGSKGVRFGSSDNTNRFGFVTGNQFGNARYWFVNNGTNTPLTNKFPPNVDSTFDVSVTRVSGNTHRVTVTRGGTTFTTNFTASGAVDRAVFFNSNQSGNSDDTNNLFFNLLTLTVPQDSGGTNSMVITNPVFTTNLTSAKTFTANFEPEVATSLAIETPGTWALGTALPNIRVLALTDSGDPDPAFDAMVILTIIGPDGFSQQYQAAAVEGIATFQGITLPVVGSFQLQATSGNLATGSAIPLTIQDAAIFLPSGSADWNTATNWDIGVVPNGDTARAQIPTIAADRNVAVSSHITLASLLFDNATTANRNRIRNNGASASLTMQSADGPAQIIVRGNGTGYANLEFTDPGSLVLASDVILDVQNAAAGNAEYGALRLQGNVSGSGGLIKRGPGLAGLTGAGKTFTGDVLIEQGVLTFSEPAISGNGVTNYTVQPGGQLRLSSAGAPRNYNLKGPLYLAGTGRTGVPEEENLGVLGALRLETGTTGTTAILTNVVNLVADADIHVTAGNAIRLEGPLQGVSSLGKSGGGTLTLAAGASGFGGAIAVNRGALALDAADFAGNTNPLTLLAETALEGTGRWPGVVQASSGSAINFRTGPSPLTTSPLNVGRVLATGSVTIAVQPAEGSIEGTYPLLSVDDSFTGLGNLVLNLGTTNFPASQLVFSNNILALSLRSTSPTPRESWLEHYGLPADGSGEGADEADPDHDGISNLLERAFGLDPLVSDGLPIHAISQEGELVVTYHVNKGQSDITVRPFTTSNLAGGVWSEATPTLVDDSNPAFTVFQIKLPLTPGAGFVRFRVQRQE